MWNLFIFKDAPGSNPTDILRIFNNYNQKFEIILSIESSQSMPVDICCWDKVVPR